MVGRVGQVGQHQEMACISAAFRKPETARLLFHGSVESVSADQKVAGIRLDRLKQ
jgi:hypothetical protein